jgi:uncharacterized protein (TIGR03437 family)
MVGAGATSATFSATTGTVSTSQTATITATLNGTATTTVSLTAPAPPSGTTYSLWSSTSKPVTVSDSDTQSVELGVKFQANVAGSVAGVSFYKGSTNGGTHTGHLWSSTGTLLASVTFANETASGWQHANFSAPVAISANTTYVVSYHATGGHYSDDTNYFSSALTNGPLTALANGQSGSNGVYTYSSGTAFPTSGWESSNYWVDLIFQENTQSSSSSSTKTTSKVVQGSSDYALACSPKAVQPGGTFKCELQSGGALQSVDLTASGSSNVTLPDTATARANQHSLSFQGAIQGSPASGSITISANAGNRQAEDTIVVLAPHAPVLTVPADQLIKYGTSVGFKVSADPAVLSVSNLPANASFDKAGRFEWTPAAGQQGTYDVAFTAKNLTGTSTKTVHFEVDAGAPAISNAAKFACSPGAMGTLSGKWLGPDSPAADASGSSTELGGTSVRVNGTAAPLLFAGKTRAAFLCPAGQPGDALQIVLETPAGATQTLQTTMQAASPMLLAVEDGEQGMIFRAGTAELATVRDAKGAGQPAQPSDTLAIRATGLGNGNAVSVKIGGTSADVLSIAPGDQAGLWEVLASIPSAAQLGDAVPVQLEVTSPDGKQLQSNSVAIAIEAARF